MPSLICEHLLRMGHEFVAYVKLYPFPPPECYRAQPNIKILDFHSLTTGDNLAETFSGIGPAVLSGAEMDSLDRAWRYYSQVANRQYVAGRSMEDHYRYFRDMMRYAVGMIRQLKVDTVFFIGTVPHTAKQFIFYYAGLLCGCKPVIITQHQQEVFIREHWDEPLFPPGHGAGLKVDDAELAERIADNSSYFREVANNDEREEGDGAIPKTASLEAGQVSDMNKHALNMHGKAWYKTWLDDILYTLHEAKYHALLDEKRLRRAASGRDYLPTKWPRFTGFKVVMRNLVNSRRLYSAYSSLAQTPDLSTPYIYLGLHREPEESTTPSGGSFRDQMMVAAVLAAALPKGWKLYIKEHPTQMVGRYPFLFLDTMYGRIPQDYHSFAALPNTVLVPVDYDHNALIANAKVCATVTGSLGWQAMLAGKPAIFFGNADYWGCRGCERAASKEEAEEALTRLTGMTSDEVKKSLHEFMSVFATGGIVHMPQNSHLDRILNAATEQYFQDKDLFSGLAGTIAKAAVERISK